MGERRKEYFAGSATAGCPGLAPCGDGKGVMRNAVFAPSTQDAVIRAPFGGACGFASVCLLLASGFCPLHSYPITGDGFLAAPAVRGKPSNSGRLHGPAELGQGRLNPAPRCQLKGADHTAPVAALLQFDDGRLVN